MEVLAGIWAFLQVAFLILVVIEFSVFVEEFVFSRLELRRGFSGTKTSPLRIFSRHALKVLRTEGTYPQYFAAGAKYLLIFLAAGLLPTWGNQILLDCPHSLWVFTALVVISPILHLIFEWAIKKGTGWPAVLVTAERTIGSTTVHFILAITLVAMTGFDAFTDLKKLQLESGWLILKYPWAIFLLFSYAVVNLFTSFQTIFSRTQDEKDCGWSFDQLLPLMRRATWTLFIVDIFLGGASGPPVIGDVLLILKCVSINVLSSFGSQLFFHLREDQAEAFILWRLAPISILVLAFSLLFPGGLF